MELPIVGDLEQQWTKARELVTRLGLKAGVGRRYTGRVLAALSPDGVRQAAEVMEWARTYLSQPHPELGRKGAVCPFVPRSINLGRFFLVLHEELDGADLTALRDVLLSHADGFLERFPHVVPDDEFNSLLMVFPRVPPERDHVVDTIHTELKSYLMMKKGLMLSQFHPRATKGAIRNEKFQAYQAPYPCIVLRHMGVHDIIFLGHNAKAFSEYHRRFGPRYARGEIGNEHGYVDLYEAAKQRHGVT